MKTAITLLIVFLLACTSQAPAQNAANKSKAYSVKSKTHASKAHSRSHAHMRHKARGK